MTHASRIEYHCQQRFVPVSVHVTMANTMKRLLLAVTLVAFAAGACTNDRNTTTTSHETGERKMQRRTLQHDGIEREFFVHIPRGYDTGTVGLPLVVGIHGYTSTATGFAAAHNLNPHADEHGYIVVYPQGSHFSRCWPERQFEPDHIVE